MDRADPYIIMENTEAARPQKSFLVLTWRAKIDTSATVANIVMTKAKSPRILTFSFLVAKVMKMMT